MRRVAVRRGRSTDPRSALVIEAARRVAVCRVAVRRGRPTDTRRALVRETAYRVGVGRVCRMWKNRYRGQQVEVNHT